MQESFNWDGRDYILYYEDETVKQKLVSLARKMQTPGTVKHIAVVPEEERVFTFLIPKHGTVEENLKPILNWIKNKQFAVEEKL